MKGFLTKNQIEYVLFHLRQSFKMDEELSSRIEFNTIGEPKSTTQNKIIFLLSDKVFSLHNIVYIESLPILFPVGADQKLFFFDKKNNLIFRHDILKSAFYLLSGYQEYVNDKKDSLGRFPYKESIQYSLEIIKKPIVNYYFLEISKGIKEFSERENFSCEEKKLFNPFAFFLSHDIDRVKKYTFNYFLYSIKRFIPSQNVLNTSFSYNIKELFACALGLFRLKPDPFWNFNYLIKLEKKYVLSSTFYFLEKLRNEENYSFKDKKLIQLFKELINNEKEIGLHGTIESANDANAFSDTLKKLENSSKNSIQGLRYHNLVFSIPESMKIAAANNIKYDSTLGYAEHEGFRNSYCLPFMLFDFENDRTINVIEIPLNIMDVTLYHYRSLNFKQAEDTVIELIEEVGKFGGIVSLLWHNSSFDENLYPGITIFYETLLKKISSKTPQILTPCKMIEQLF